MTQPNVWIVMETLGHMEYRTTYVDKVFSSQFFANNYIIQKEHEKTHYKTGRKRSPSRYLNGSWNIQEFKVY